jgi:hypothetical protein
LTLSALRLCTQSVFKWTTAVKFKIQLYAIWHTERKQKHNEVKIAISNPVLIGGKKQKMSGGLSLKNATRNIVFERRSLRRENEA